MGCKWSQNFIVYIASSIWHSIGHGSGYWAIQMLTIALPPDHMLGMHEHSRQDMGAIMMWIDHVDSLCDLGIWQVPQLLS